MPTAHAEFKKNFRLIIQDTVITTMKNLIHISLQLKLVLFLTAMVIYLQSCKYDDMYLPENNMEMPANLTDHNIFQGKPSDLIPGNGFLLYEIPTQLFSDFAEKQRLIKVPAGEKLTALNNGLPNFPEGTILVKTFYYFNDKRDTSKGKKIIETRLLVKKEGKWNVGTYAWNNEQTDANLISAGRNKTFEWITENGNTKTVSFHIPSNRECATCHHANRNMLPLGPKIRNLNMDVTRSGGFLNQLTYFQNTGILHSQDPSLFTRLPNSKDQSFTLQERARAYLDINCAHCHNVNGDAKRTGLYLDYELPLNETKITSRKKQINKLMSAGKMPKLGITIIDEESISLIKKYLESL